MNVLVIGGGGREHALAWKLAAEPGVNEVVVAPGSDAIAREPRVRLASVDPLDPPAIIEVARQRAVELVVIGPEAPLAAGVADALSDAGILVFGPSAAAARIESSKAFCHEVAEAAGVAMARASAFDDAGPAKAYARDEAARSGGSVVVKADGLAAGKGVVVASSADEALAAIYKATELDPLAPLFQAHYAWILHCLGRDDQAWQEIRSTLDVHPNDYYTLRILLYCANTPQRQKIAIEAGHKLSAISKSKLVGQGMLGVIYALSGERDQAHEIAKQLEQRTENEPLLGYYLGAKDGPADLAFLIAAARDSIACCARAQPSPDGAA
jgi:tetratricopeptide (TPR) repeat protein